MMRKAPDPKSVVFLDESGKPEVFSQKGINLVQGGVASRFLVIAAVRTPDQLAVQEAVTTERLSLLRDPTLTSIFSSAYTLDSFHAQTDYPEVKQRFFQWIRDCSIELKISVIVAEKLKAYPHLQQDASQLYANVAGQLLKRFLHKAEDIEVIFSRRDSSLKARQNLQLVIDTLRIQYAQDHQIDLKTNIRYFHNPHYTHGGLQIADYIAHAVFQVVEFNRRSWYELIRGRIGYIQDIFNQKSYTRGNPL